MTEYQQGVHDTYEVISDVINTAIRKNGGATTALQIINVFNEITSHVHYNLAGLKQEKESETEDALLDVIRSLNSELGGMLNNVIVLTKGGDFK